MRGKRPQGAQSGAESWNTPAYAGKTLHHQHVRRAKPDFSTTSISNKTGFTAWILPAPKGGASALLFGGEYSRIAGGNHHC